VKEWKNPWQAAIGPLMIWVAFITIVPLIAMWAVSSTEVLTLTEYTIARAVCAFCVLVLTPLATFAEIAPPFVTKIEVRWRNRNHEKLFVGTVGWEAVAFLPPMLNRIRSMKGRLVRHGEREAESEQTNHQNEQLKRNRMAAATGQCKAMSKTGRTARLLRENHDPDERSRLVASAHG
jgi:hypothetical protein